MKLTRTEMETNILTNKDVKEWDCWTLDPAFAKKLERLGYELKTDKQGGWSCGIPKGRVSIKRREKRQVSEKTLAALQAARERLRQPRQDSGNSK